MNQVKMDGDDGTSLLERLRQQADRVSRLESVLVLAEVERQNLQQENHRLEREVARLQAQKAEFDLMFERGLDLFCIHDQEGSIVRVNAACTALLGYGQQEFVAQQMESIVHPDDLPAVRANLEAIFGGADCVNFEARLRHKDGRWRWFAWTCPGVTMGAPHLCAIARDITDSRLSAEGLLYQAQHDVLTGLGNRAMFEHSLRQAVSRAARSVPACVALLLFDLDGFKAINDTFGHVAGDQVLRVIAERLQFRRRAGEIICRLGGDEFAWILEGPDTLEIEVIAQVLLTEVCRPIDLGSVQVRVGCSIGISSFPDMSDNDIQLIEHADEAMYRVKRAGKNNFAFFGPHG